MFESNELVVEVLAPDDVLDSGVLVESSAGCGVADVGAGEEKDCCKTRERTAAMLFPDPVGVGATLLLSVFPRC